ncbi:hypothetical protein DSO57_1006415 [Entomophthora muscae]|uniref:Uncharacterized protein n=1 Tax=Entomophthora muscae TaxID=34485 RepID=A0ACC2UGP0_9FUNG|nr:hypothetical protein DSO57_1006415 [Entomophthora muscae]
MKPKVVDSMLMDLMAVEKHVSTPPICTEVKHPHLFSPVLEKAKYLLSSCTQQIPMEPSPTCSPSPSFWTKAGICREDAPSPKDVNKSKKHLKLFEDSIQTLLDKLSTFSEELGDEQRQEIEAKIGKHVVDAMAKIPNLDQTPEDVVEEGEEILSCEQQLDIEFEEDKLQPTQEPLPISPMTGIAKPMVVVEKSLNHVSYLQKLAHYLKQKVFEGVPKTRNDAVVNPDNNQIYMETSPLIEHVSYENTPMDTSETSAFQKRMITPNSNKKHIPTIRLPINLASKAETLQLSAQAMDLLKNTNIQVSWAKFCKALNQAIMGMRPCRTMPSMLVETGAPRTIAMVDGHSTFIILDGGSYANIVSKDFLDHIGNTDIVSCDTQFMLADGVKLLVKIHAVVFDHKQYNLLVGRKTLKDFMIITDYENNHWTMQKDRDQVPFPISYLDPLSHFSPYLDSDPVESSFLFQEVIDMLDLGEDLSMEQKEIL